MLRFYCGVLGCTVERRQDEIGLIQLRAGRSIVDLVPMDGKFGGAGGAAPGKEGHNLAGLLFLNVASAEEGCDLVLQGDVQAVVFDAPTLQYLAAKRGNGVLRVVGPIFASQKYGIAVADGSALRKRINRALLEMYEDGRYSALYNKWFSQ